MNWNQNITSNVPLIKLVSVLSQIIYIRMSPYSQVIVETRNGSECSTNKGKFSLEEGKFSLEGGKFSLEGDIVIINFHGRGGGV